MLSQRIAALDPRLFSYVESQTTESDRRSLLAIHNALTVRLGQFTYLEIGSHLGGSLQVVLADARCTKVTSIDPRPQSQPDDRRGHPQFEYVDNSTERMLTLLREVPGIDLTKLETIEASTEELAPRDFEQPDLCLIDGEHTSVAALRDARFCRSIGARIVVFHDFGIIAPAVWAFLRELPPPWRAYGARSDLFVVELGDLSVMDDPRVGAQVRPRFGWRTANRFGMQPSYALAHLRMHHARLWTAGLLRRSAKRARRAI